MSATVRSSVSAARYAGIVMMTLGMILPDRAVLILDAEPHRGDDGGPRIAFPFACARARARRHPRRIGARRGARPRAAACRPPAKPVGQPRHTRRRPVVTQRR